LAGQSAIWLLVALDRNLTAAASHECLDTLFEFTTGEEHTSTARLAHHPDIRPQAHDLPFISAARMRLAQAHLITQSNFQHHL
jgi:hypothetical protein